MKNKFNNIFKPKSIVSKLFTTIIALSIILYSLTTIVQLFIIPNVFLNSARKSIEAEINNLYDKSTISTFRENLDNFSQITQTSNILLSDENLTPNTENTFVFSVLGSDKEGNQFIVLLNNLNNTTFEKSSLISGSFVELNYNLDLPVVYPSELYLNGSKIYTSETNSEDTELSLIINEIHGKDNNLYTFDKFDVFQDEVFQILTGNLEGKTQTEKGYFYNSKTDDSSNLVYVSNLVLGTEPYTLLTVYSENQILNITNAYSTVTLAFTVLSLIFTIIILRVFYRQINKPLVQISKTCKDIADLNFDTVVEIPKDSYEITYIAKNIDVMKKNLQIALNELKNKNKQISKQIENESSRENIRRDFVSGMSHELKTPLAVIKATFEGIANGIFEEEELEEQYEVIFNEVDKSNKLIQRMMKVYEIEDNHSEKNLSTFNLTELIKKINNSLSKLAEAKEINVHLSLDEAFVYSDYSKLELVISNFYSNALKYTSSGETIMITLKKTDKIEFNIINTGITIPEESINFVFEPFYRVNKARSREDGSTGLGLYIVKQILEQLKYKYGVENGNDSVKFFFTIDKDVIQ